MWNLAQSFLEHAEFGIEGATMVGIMGGRSLSTSAYSMRSGEKRVGSAAGGRANEFPGRWQM